MIVVTVHNQRRNGDLPQVLREIGLGERDNAVLVPPILAAVTSLTASNSAIGKVSVPRITSLPRAADLMCCSLLVFHVPS